MSKKSVNKTESLNIKFLQITLFPLLVFGIVVSVFMGNTIRECVEKETKSNLKNVASAVMSAYDALYPGDFSYMQEGDDIVFYKGDVVLSEENELIDRIKEGSNVDISFIVGNTRVITTLSDKNGKRATNTIVGNEVFSDVVENGNTRFFDNVIINDRNQKYFVYYEPVLNENGASVGCIGVAKAQTFVNKDVKTATIKIIIIIVLALIVTGFFIIRFAREIIATIERTLDFLRELTNDNLNAKIDERVLKRRDELAEMGQASVKLQISLKKLIERDVLTGLYNRRAGEKKLAELEKQGVKSAISIGDIDHFKKFNDNFGHECGDEVLKTVAKVLNSGMKGKGFVARWGGEEFLLVFENTDAKTAYGYLEEILENVRAEKVQYHELEHSVTMTFGVTDRKEEEQISDQIRRADDKLYDGKQGGRNRVIR